MKVTFVDTGSVQSKPFATNSDKVQQHNNVVFVSVLVGVQASDDQTLAETTMERGSQAGNLIDLISNMEDSEITCVVADVTMGWILAEVAQKLPVRTVAFCPASMASLALACHIPELIEAGSIDTNGKIVRSDEVISLSADIPPWKASELNWKAPRNDETPETEKFLFELCKTSQKTVESC